ERYRRRGDIAHRSVVVTLAMKHFGGNLEYTASSEVAVAALSFLPFVAHRKSTYRPIGRLTLRRGLSEWGNRAAGFAEQIEPGETGQPADGGIDAPGHSGAGHVAENEANHPIDVRIVLDAAA